MYVLTLYKRKDRKLSRKILAFVFVNKTFICIFFLISNLNKPISINWLLFYKNFYFPWHKLSIKTPRITALFPYKRGNPCIFYPSAQSGSMSAEEFHSALQEATNFPLRGFVLPYLKHTLPALQRDLSAAARADNQVSTKKNQTKR